MRSHHRINFCLWRRMNSRNSHARLATSPFTVEFSHIINTCYQTTPTECSCARLTLRMRISSLASYLSKRMYVSRLGMQLYCVLRMAWPALLCLSSRVLLPRMLAEVKSQTTTARRVGKGLSILLL